MQFGYHTRKAEALHGIGDFKEAPTASSTYPPKRIYYSVGDPSSIFSQLDDACARRYEADAHMGRAFMDKATQDLVLQLVWQFNVQMDAVCRTAYLLQDQDKLDRLQIIDCSRIGVIEMYVASRL